MDMVCPCISSGGNELHVILLVCAVWIGFRWWSSRRQAKKWREAVKQDEQNSQSLFEGKSQPPADSEPKSTAMGMAKAAKVAIVVVLAIVVVAVLILKNRGNAGTTAPEAAEPGTPAPSVTQASGLPRMIELGSVSCIPCKMMAPILEELRKEYAGKLQADFIDVNQDRDAARKFGIRVIPTQVFLDAGGKELFRHEGFFPKEEILAKWNELGVNLAAPAPGAPSSSAAPAFERLQPAQTDTRAKDKVCYMCDGDIQPQSAVTVRSAKGEVRLCGPHCYFIMYSSLTEDKTDFEKKVLMTDRISGKPVPATEATFLYGIDEKNGRPTIAAFADKATAEKERQSQGGNLLTWAQLQQKELAARCGFCDRAVYPEDAALVKADGLYTWGCCSHCAMGVAARTGKDIEVHQRDGLTGEMIVVKTVGSKVASLEPSTSVAWFGQRKNPEGKWVSAGCFHQGFFTSEASLKKWVDQHPFETGREISIQRALDDKLALNAQQILKACKIGECAPK